MMLALIMAAAAAPADAPQWNCEDPGPQQELNWCAHQDYLKADEALNQQWKETAAEMKRRDAEWATGFEWDKRPGYFDTLLEAQRAWIRYRGAHCASQGYIFRGGSMEPLMVSTCKTAMTEERTRQLKEMIEAEE